MCQLGAKWCWFYYRATAHFTPNEVHNLTKLGGDKVSRESVRQTRVARLSVMRGAASAPSASLLTARHWMTPGSPFLTTAGPLGPRRASRRAPTSAAEPAAPSTARRETVSSPAIGVASRGVVLQPAGQFAFYWLARMFTTC